MTVKPRIGIDLGGTKIEGIVLSGSGEITDRKRVVTPRGSYRGTLDALVKLIRDLQSNDPSISVGIGTPGAVSKVTGLMKNCNSTWMNGENLVADLSALLQQNIRIANDADCFALSEASDGAAAGGGVVFGVILGTGVGGGLCVDGNLISGVNAITGEWGHTTLPLNAIQNGSSSDLAMLAGRVCDCGRQDCVETWLAGPSLEHSYELASGESLAAVDVVKAMRMGAPIAEAVFDQYCHLLALGLSTVINILDPRVIVFGGGVSNTVEIYPRVRNYLPRYVFSDRVDTRLVAADFGDSSGVRGAAWLWPTTNIERD